MVMLPVESSHIAAIGHEDNTLYVRFKDQSLYSYHGVPEQIFNNLMNASSKGRYLAQHIKNHYPYSKIS